MKNKNTIMSLISIGEKYYIHSWLVAGFLFVVYLFSLPSSFLYSSVLNYAGMSGDPFDGTIYPISHVPDPFRVSYELRKGNFSDIDSKDFIPLPLYDAGLLARDISAFPAGSANYTQIRMQRLIYTVPYMGNYKLEDYREYEGSHAGVDILAPIDTPVVSIANGLVVEVGNQPSGFGKYILIKHSQVPYEGKNQTLYSLYGHLNGIDIQEGVKVLKGDTIGRVGQTGTATAPHLHFQIDTDTAAFHPFWPFSSVEAQQAGVGFFEAINIGLGKQIAMTSTINPLKFVNENLVFSSPVENSDREEPEEQDQSGGGEHTPDDQDNNIQPEKEQGDENGNEDDINEDIENNIPDVEINNQDALLTKVEIVDYELELLTTLDISSLIEKKDDLIVYAGDLPPKTNTSIPEENTQIQEDSNKDNQPSLDENQPEDEMVEDDTFTLFADIDDDYLYYNELQYFKDLGIIDGFHDKTFRPSNNITRAESLKILLLSFEHDPVVDMPSQFLDINTNTWENTYINAGVDLGIISLDNQRFYPFRNISRVEGLKLVFLLGGIEIEQDAYEQIFEDVMIDDWYFGYVGYALEHGLLGWDEDGEYFYPDQPLSREELMLLMYQYIQK